MRHKTFEVKIGNIKIGGNNPIAVQSMTNTNTGDAEATIKQINELADAGSEMVRVTVNDDAAAKAVPLIKAKINVPLIGDFHYNGHILLEKYPECAKALDKYRINPGNVGFGDKHDENFKKMVDIAIKYDKPVRIGVNAGSVDKIILNKLMDENKGKDFREILVESVVQSTLISAKKAEEYGLGKDKIVLSAKVSDVQDVIKVYELLAKKSNYALHVGLTEAGIGTKGIVASTAAIGVLLQQGIGDTIRVSITPKPGQSRTEEVIVSQNILQTMNIRKFRPMVTSCPGCGRTSSNVFQKMAMDVNDFLEKKAPEWKKKNYKGFESMHIAVMGCIVNGPGESEHADIGISMPGSGENPNCPVYVDGKLFKTLSGSNITEEFEKIIEEYVERKFRD